MVAAPIPGYAWGMMLPSLYAALRRALGAAALAVLALSSSSQAQNAPVPSPATAPATDMSSISTSPSTHSHSHTNRLAREKSPYLLQHQHNPVDWYAWGEEAFAKARSEQKPIFLSIGYSTCHWCHVMERESFEDENLAAFLNAHFVSIKVDREERPDVDKIYMTAVQAMTGQGGWPLNIFLTPELKPFYGGTYFPPVSKYGRPSFIELLQQIEKVWKGKRDDLEASAQNLHDQMERFLSQPVTNAPPVLDAKIVEAAMKSMMDDYDSTNGGFGGAPKFPRPTVPSLILRAGRRFHNQQAIDMVLHTCDAMAAGGIYDQIGDGFARYSTDAHWLVPHFEKMLYDNAQLLALYLDAWLVSGREEYATVARGIVRYVLRDMTHPGGGFYSAEDADSEGKEGKFYCWTRQELSQLLTPAEFEFVVHYYGVTEEGNFVDHSDPHPLPNQNILFVADRSASVINPLLVSAKAKLFAVRATRVRPHLDDKVLCSWNGMMLGALARAGIVLNEPSYLAAAETNFAFLRTKLWDEESKTLYNRWRDGERDKVQIVEAYANLLAGVLDLYEATLDPKHLAFAITLTESMIARFYDTERGGFYQSLAAPDLILRTKDDYDGAEPSANSVAILALYRLAAITERKDFRDVADKSLRLFGPRLLKMPEAVPNFLCALEFSLNEPHRAVIAGDPGDKSAYPLLVAVHSVYQPDKVVLGNTGPVEPFAKTLPVDGPAKAFICTGTACRAPTRDAEKIRAYLK